ncbi:hypothetical protein ACWGIA_17670 [Streptomyces bobili]
MPQVGEIHLIVIKSDSVYACLKVGAADRSSPSRVRVTLAPHPAAASGRHIRPARPAQPSSVRLEEGEHSPGGVRGRQGLLEVRGHPGDARPKRRTGGAARG